MCIKYIMPRIQGGIGRTGSKHKRPATHDLHRQVKTEGGDQDDAGPSSALAALSDAKGAAESAAASVLGVADMQVALADCAEEEAGGGGGSGGGSDDSGRGSGDEDGEDMEEDQAWRRKRIGPCGHDHGRCWEGRHPAYTYDKA